MVEVATMLVTTGGEDALQMSEMPSLAEVSLATLYRYFPSKEHLLFAVVQQHLESALARAHPSQRGWPDRSERVAKTPAAGIRVRPAGADDGQRRAATGRAVRPGVQ